MASSAFSILFQNPYAAVIGFRFWIFVVVTSIALQAVMLVNEWDASFKKAYPILRDGNYLDAGELRTVKKLLFAAAMTYLAAAIKNLLINFLTFRRGR